MWKICLFQLLKFDTFLNHLMRVNEESFDFGQFVGEKEQFEGITFASGIWESIFDSCVLHYLFIDYRLIYSTWTLPADYAMTEIIVSCRQPCWTFSKCGEGLGSLPHSHACLSDLCLKSAKVNFMFIPIQAKSNYFSTVSSHTPKLPHRSQDEKKDKRHYKVKWGGWISLQMDVN